MASVVTEVPSVDQPKHSRRPMVLRVLGLLLVGGGIAALLIPVSYEGISGPGRTDCGVPLQGLFRPPNEGCQRAADHRVSLSLGLAGAGLLMLAFSGLKRRLRFLGLVLVALSPYLMMFGIDDTNREIIRGNQHFQYFCGSAVGDLVRRGYSEVGDGGTTWGIHPGCGEDALKRLYLTLGVAAGGLAILGVAGIRQRHDPQKTRPQ